eukprot:1192322-Prorocentrum_minimum.AAC.4
MLRAPQSMLRAPQWMLGAQRAVFVFGCFFRASSKNRGNPKSLVFRWCNGVVRASSPTSQPARGERVVLEDAQHVLVRGPRGVPHQQVVATRRHPHQRRARHLAVPQLGEGGPIVDGRPFRPGGGVDGRDDVVEVPGRLQQQQLRPPERPRGPPLPLPRAPPTPRTGGPCTGAPRRLVAAKVLIGTRGSSVSSRWGREYLTDKLTALLGTKAENVTCVLPRQGAVEVCGHSAHLPPVRHLLAVPLALVACRHAIGPPVLRLDEIHQRAADRPPLLGGTGAKIPMDSHRIPPDIIRQIVKNHQDLLSSTVDTSIPFSARHFEYSTEYSTYIPC